RRRGRRTGKHARRLANIGRRRRRHSSHSARRRGTGRPRREGADTRPAHRLATGRLTELCALRGRDRVVAAMDELFDYSERIVRAAIARLPDGKFEAEDVLEAPEGDLAIRAAITIDGDEIAFDFDGTAAQHSGNLNCPLSVTRS